MSSNMKPVWEHFSGSTPSWIFVAYFQKSAPRPALYYYSDEFCTELQ